jgi:drug/metabolite transporter (DMT)-like permease
MCIFLFPLALLERFILPGEDRTNWFTKKDDLPFPAIVHILLAGLFWSGNLETWVYALQYTTTVRASVFASSHPLMLVVLLSILGHKVSLLEWLGVLVAIGGLLLCSGQGFFDTGGASAGSTLFGDGLCLVAAMAEVLVLLNRQKTKKYVPLMQVS